MMGLFMEFVESTWRSTPDPAKDLLRRTPIYRYFLERYFSTNVELVEAKIHCGDFHMTVPVPEGERPWWSGFENTGCHEPLATRTYVDLIDAGDVVWDMGSKFGYETAIAVQLNRSPEDVHVFEVDVSSCVFLEYVSERYYGGALNVVNKAVGAVDGRRSVSGDAYARRAGPPDFVKMDIDGGEVLAVDGMSEVIETSRPTFLVEIHPAHIRRLTGRSDEELVQYLDEVYDRSRICWAYREVDAEWQAFDRPEWEQQRKYRQSYQMLFSG